MNTNTRQRMWQLGAILVVVSIVTAAGALSSRATSLSALEQGTLVAGDGSAAMQLGATVAVSGDTMLVGAPGARSPQGGVVLGAAFVFVRSGSGWARQARLDAADVSTSDDFAGSVAISGDTAVVGASRDDIGTAVDAGSAYVFTRSGSVWSQQAKLTVPAAGGQFGQSVAIDGDTVLVTAPNQSVDFNKTGRAYVYVRTGTTWSLQDTVEAAFGSTSFRRDTRSAAVAGDTAVIGAKDFGNDTGAAYIFERTGTSWTQTDYLVGSDNTFGGAVATSGDRVIVTASGTPGAAYVFTRTTTGWSEEAVLATSGGIVGDAVAISGETAVVSGGSANQQVYVFTHDTTGWSEEAVLAASDGMSGDFFGGYGSVALDGSTVLIGAPGANTDEGPDAGAAYTFAGSDTGWSQDGKLTASDGSAAMKLGYSVAISGDTALVGAPGAQSATGGITTGSAFVFVRSGSTWVLQARLVASDGGAFDHFGEAVALSGDTALVGAPFDNNGTVQDAGSAYVFTRSGTTWTQQAKLTAGGQDSFFGRSVALDGDTAMVSAPNQYVDFNRTGRAYVYVRTGTTWAIEATFQAGTGRNSFSQQAGSIDLDGETAFIGAPGYDRPGAAYVYTRTGSSWNELDYITGPDGRFGTSLSLAGDRAIVSSPAIIELDGFAGAAYIFSRTANTWTQEARLTAAADPYADFPRSVAIEADTVLLGGSGTSASVFTRTNTGWDEQLRLTAPDIDGSDFFGFSVALDGVTALVGAPFVDSDSGSDAGAAFAFGLGASVPDEVCDGTDNDGNGQVDEGFADTDGDSLADCVDTDDDNDLYSDDTEVAAGSDPLDANSVPEVCDGLDNDRDGSTDEGFTDTDGDGAADCADTDDDGDGQTDASELACGSDPLNAQSVALDTDHDGTPDCVDDDDDADGVADATDNCSLVANADQRDADGDRIGDACDSLTYSFTGFASPVDNPPVLNVATAGKTVPIKYRLTLDGSPVTDPASFTRVTSAKAACGTLDVEGSDALETYSGSSGLQSLGDGYWQLNWATSKSYAGATNGPCRVLTVELADGSRHTANFRFK